jgi:hypothetical protein
MKKIDREKFKRYQRECQNIKLDEIINSTMENNIKITEKLLTSKPFSNYYKKETEPISISYLLKNKNAE